MRNLETESVAKESFERRKPCPEDFGIEGYSAIQKFQQRQKSRRDSAKSLRGIFSVLICHVVGFSPFFLYDDIDRAGEIAIYSFPVAIVFYLIFPSGVVEQLLARKQCDHLLAQRIEAFEASQADFDHFVLMARLDFWRRLRGVNLENEAAAIFRNAGWQVSTTPLVADGGVDLILSREGEEIFCQCKGHAKPVSVSAVREIAGVCVGTSAKPLLLAVNGLTKPAQAEAARLGVMVFDAKHLADLARGVSTFGPLGYRQ